MIVAIESHQGALDMQVTAIGLDIAKNVFQVHGIDATEKVVVRKQLRRISKQGDRYLRRILVVGAHAVLKLARQKPEKYPWLTQLLARKPFRVVAVALANKMARIAWALLAKGGIYRAPALAAAA